jgi:hypothetical protein
MPRRLAEVIGCVVGHCGSPIGAEKNRVTVLLKGVLLDRPWSTHQTLVILKIINYFATGL